MPKNDKPRIDETTVTFEDGVVVLRNTVGDVMASIGPDCSAYERIVLFFGEWDLLGDAGAVFAALRLAPRADVSYPTLESKVLRKSA